MSIHLLDWEYVRRERLKKCYLNDGRPPLNLSDAAQLVNERGFMLLGVLAKRSLPNMSETDHGREWNVSWLAWEWKERLPETGACCYMKWFYNQGTFISWEVYPHFFSLWGLRHSPEVAYAEGMLTRHEHLLLTVIGEEGPINSRDLWRKVHRDFGGKRALMLNALLRLQRLFAVAVAGGDTAGWSMHTWDLVSRAIPSGLIDRLPRRDTAVRSLILQTASTVPYCTISEVSSLFRWAPSFVNEVAADMANEGLCSLDYRISGLRSACITITG